MVDARVDPEQKCTQCGAGVVTGCPNCGLRVRGEYYAAGVIGFSSNYELPGFCDECGSAFPWATREQRIYELENILDQQEMAEHDRLFIAERLRELHSMDGSDRKAQANLWKRIRSYGPAFATHAAVRRIAEGLGVEGAGSAIFG